MDSAEGRREMGSAGGRGGQVGQGEERWAVREGEEGRDEVRGAEGVRRQ